MMVLGPDGNEVGDDGISFNSLEDFVEKSLPQVDNPGTLSEEEVAFVLRVVVDLSKAQEEFLTSQDKDELVDKLSGQMDVPPQVASVYLDGFRAGFIQMIDLIQDIYEGGDSNSTNGK